MCSPIRLRTGVEGNQLAGQRIAVILHDSGTRYLDTIFDDAWVAHKLGLSPADIRRMIDDIDA